MSTAQGASAEYQDKMKKVFFECTKSLGAVDVGGICYGHGILMTDFFSWMGLCKIRKAKWKEFIESSGSTKKVSG